MRKAITFVSGVNDVPTGDRKTVEGAYLATVHILIVPGVCENETDACTWMSNLLSENDDVLDWGYVRVGDEVSQPIPIMVHDPYHEGEGLPKARMPLQESAEEL